MAIEKSAREKNSANAFERSYRNQGGTSMPIREICMVIFSGYKILARRSHLPMGPNSGPPSGAESSSDHSPRFHPPSRFPRFPRFPQFRWISSTSLLESARRYPFRRVFLGLFFTIRKRSRETPQVLPVGSIAILRYVSG